MAISYVKVWTLLLHEEWYLALNSSERGVLLQLLLRAKEGTEDGRVVADSWTSLAQNCGTTGRQLAKWRAKMHDLGRIESGQLETGQIYIYLRNFVKWQEITAKQVQQYVRRQAELKRRGVSTTGTRPDQTKPKHKEVEGVEEEEPRFSP